MDARADCYLLQILSEKAREIYDISLTEQCQTIHDQFCNVVPAWSIFLLPSGIFFRIFPKWILLNSVNHHKIQKWYGYQGDYLSTDRYISSNIHFWTLSFTEYSEFGDNYLGKTHLDISWFFVRCQKISNISPVTCIIFALLCNIIFIFWDDVNTHKRNKG